MGLMVIVSEELSQLASCLSSRLLLPLQRCALRTRITPSTISMTTKPMHTIMTTATPTPSTNSLQLFVSTRMKNKNGPINVQTYSKNIKVLRSGVHIMIIYQNRNIWKSIVTGISVKLLQGEHWHGNSRWTLTWKFKVNIGMEIKMNIGMEIPGEHWHGNSRWTLAWKFKVNIGMEIQGEHWHGNSKWTLAWNFKVNIGMEISNFQNGFIEFKPNNIKWMFNCEPKCGWIIMATASKVITCFLGVVFHSILKWFWNEPWVARFRDWMGSLVQLESMGSCSLLRDNMSDLQLKM